MSALYFDIDTSDLRRVASDLGASEKQVRYAFNFARKRTATSLRTMAARGLKDELQLRTVTLLRKRLKSAKLKSADDGLALWFGLNDMPVSWFKGTPRRSAGGATARGHEFAGAFVAESTFKGRRTVFKRKGKGRLPIEEQNIPVSDQAQVYIEDEIFVKTEELFWKYFQRDLAARVKFKIGES